ncbi:MAG: alpha/beta hydrolase fold protein [Flavipsychrobacter sp.]|jgi:pimeloyl-ACP methyl ester carboxylesterase|nr:alpha/beta hydrolase fold protein [Flavipsychrobacter sp.]
MEQKLRITVPDFPNLAYLKTGTGPAMILLHGFPESGDLWRKVWPALAAHFTVIVPDLPGSGESTFSGESVSIEGLAKSVKAIADHEQVEQVVIAGHSMGGYVALAFADLYGSKLAGLSLVHSTAAADSEEKKETRRKSIELINKGGKEAFIRQMIPALFSKGFKENKAALDKEIAKGLRLEAKSMVAFYNAMINRPERIATLNGVSYPVQWIFGKEDTVIPAKNVIQQSTLANVNLVSVYPEAAHMSMLEVPERLAKDLHEFGQYCFRLTR